jgi:hypothetical protein
MLNTKIPVMKQMIFLLLAALICGPALQAQQTETKIYTNVWGGQVDMVYNWGELRTSTATDKVCTYHRLLLPESAGQPSGW